MCGEKIPIEGAIHLRSQNIPFSLLYSCLLNDKFEDEEVSCNMCNTIFKPVIFFVLVEQTGDSIRRYSAYRTKIRDKNKIKCKFVRLNRRNLIIKRKQFNFVWCIFLSKCKWQFGILSLVILEYVVQYVVALWGG